MMKRLWRTIKMLWYGLLVGMKETEDETLHQSGIQLDSGTSIHQRVTDHRVSQALLRGEITQEVIDLRYRTYAVSRESSHYNYFSPTLAMKKGVNDYKFAENSITLDDGRELITIQDNRPGIETVYDALERIGDDGKYTDTDTKYSIIINRSEGTVPRFRLEKFITKLVVKKGSDDYCAVLDLYVSKYPNKNIKSSKPFIREIERIIDSGIKSDIFEIDSIEFETYKAYMLDDMIHFKFGDIQLERIFEYDGCYVIRIITNIIDGGTDLTEEYYSENMAEKYKNKTKKELTYVMDPDMEVRTYTCADCGKTVVYDARAVDSLDASDEYTDGTATEYLDFEVNEYDFGRMLCSKCAEKERMKLLEKIGKS